MATTDHPTQLNIGFIGLGDQGPPMAQAIAEAGWPLHVWARHPGSLAVLAGTPHTTHDSVPDLGRACDIVGLCMTDDSDVREILEGHGLLANLPANTVSGGRPAAERHKLTTFVGGDAGTAQRSRRVFAAFSSTIAYMGPSGTGQLAKLLNNASLLANLKNAEDIIAIGTSLGINPHNLVDALKTGSGSSFALQFLAGEIFPEMAQHLPELWHKDIGHFSDAIRNRNLPPSILEARAHESVEAFHTSLTAIDSTTRPEFT